MSAGAATVSRRDEQATGAILRGALSRGGGGLLAGMQ